MKNMIKLIFGMLLLISLNGCSMVAKDATRAALDEADAQIRLRWAEKWKPDLVKEVKKLAREAKEAAVAAASTELAKYKRNSEGKLERLGIKVESFDTNRDGRVSGVESLALLKEIKAKNDKSQNPLSWWEIILALGAAYIPLTGAKELARKKLNGSHQPA